MFNTKINSVQVALVVLATLVAVPLLSHTLTASVRSHTNEQLRVASDLKPWIPEHRKQFRAQRRAYERALDDCRERNIRGEGITCPDFNNPASYAAFLPQSDQVTARRSTSTENRTIRDQALLRRSIASGRCRRSLKRRGLYDDCVQHLTDERHASAKPTTYGFLNPHAHQAAQQVSTLTLKDRLEELRRARLGGGEKRSSPRRLSIEGYYRD